jgi:signal transduction histidine kinase
MKTSPWESGLLLVFRWFAGLQLIVIVPALLVRLYVLPSGQDSVLRMLWAMLATALILFVYLMLPTLSAKIGKAYWPIALTIATLGPSFGHYYMLLADDSRNVPVPLTGAWWLIPLLFVPLVIIAVQYHYRDVALYCLGTAALNSGLTFAAIGDVNAYTVPTFAVITIRTLTFVVVGFVVVWLTRIQRQQRRALAEANQRLAQYTTTLDQLATHRERNRIARELHDVLAHSLSALAIQLEAIKTLMDTNPQKARAMLEQALATTESGLAETRRALQELRASPLEDLGLAMAIADYAQSATQRAGLKLELHLPEKNYPLAPAIEQNIYRVAQEAIANAARHAQAQKISITLSQGNQQLILTVSDDGKGFDPQAQTKRRGFGIAGMRERAEMLGGELSVTSQVGHGTIVQLIYRENVS